MTVPDWSELTADQLLTLLTATQLDMRSGCELVDFATHEKTEDLSAAMLPAGGYVRCDGTNLVHRTSAFRLREELAWGIDLVRIYRVWSDPISGITCRGDRATQIVKAPDQDLAATPTVWQVTGQDLTAWLDALLGDSLFISAGANVGASMAKVLTDGGVTHFHIDPAAYSASVPTNMTYPFLSVAAQSAVVSAISVPVDSGRVSVDSGSPATRRQILSDLCGLVFFAGPWADAYGTIQLVPYVDAAVREASFTFDATMAQLVGQPRSVTRTGPSANEWTFVNTALPDVGGLPAKPRLGDGVAFRRNVTDGPSSVTAMKGLRFPAPPIQVSAASQAVLERIADAQVAAFKRTVKTATVATRSFPWAGHFDRYKWIDPALADGPWQVESMSWKDPLDGGRMESTWAKVA